MMVAGSSVIPAAIAAAVVCALCGSRLEAPIASPYVLGHESRASDPSW